MIKRNESFTCLNCKRYVGKAKSGKCRNHCKFCLYSLHTDIEPGDRKHKCKGLMKPIEIEKRKKGLYVLHKCQKCGIKKWNKIQEDDKITNLKL
jgi:biotin synthase-like enzyme